VAMNSARRPSAGRKKAPRTLQVFKVEGDWFALFEPLGYVRLQFRGIKNPIFLLGGAHYTVVGLSLERVAPKSVDNTLVVNP
jgi:hypothetical protein